MDICIFKVCLLLLAVAAASARPQEGAFAAPRTVRRRVASPSPAVRSSRQVVREEPIQIVRSVYNAPSGTDQVRRKEERAVGKDKLGKSYVQ